MRYKLLVLGICKRFLETYLLYLLYGAYNEMLRRRVVNDITKVLIESQYKVVTRLCIETQRLF